MQRSNTQVRVDVPHKCLFFCVPSVDTSTNTRSNRTVTSSNSTPLFQQSVLMLHWRRYNCEGSRYFCYFSVICCSLAFWFKRSVLECECKQNILFVNTHDLQQLLLIKLHDRSLIEPKSRQMQSEVKAQGNGHCCRGASSWKVSNQ